MVYIVAHNTIVSAIPYSNTNSTTRVKFPPSLSPDCPPPCLFTVNNKIIVKNQQKKILQVIMPSNGVSKSLFEGVVNYLLIVIG